MSFFSANVASMTQLLLAANATAFSTIGVEGHEFVKLPGGPFVMGSSAFKNAAPHWVTLSPFEISRTVISVGQYRNLVRGVPEAIRGLQPDDPVINVSWNDLDHYAKILRCVTKHWITLPSEAQWEFAARGPAVELRQLMEEELGRFQPKDVVDFVEGRLESFYTEIGGHIYTDPNGAAFQSLLRQSTPLYGWRVYGTGSGRLTPDEAYYKRGSPAPVDWGPRGSYGLKGMTGNVLEWTMDSYDPDTYPGHSRKDPWVTRFGMYKVLRGGGSWYNADAGLMRVAYRGKEKPDNSGVMIGGRLACTPPYSQSLYKKMRKGPG